MSLFVRMTDTFMSGWGKARGMKNVYVVECDTVEQAEKIVSAAHKRSEMKNIRICESCPRDRANILYTHRHFNDLGAVWKNG